MNKERILQSIIEQLTADLALLLQAAKTAHAAATHEENIPDNKYATLGLEASYLAQGQANRAQDIKRALAIYKGLTLQPFAAAAAIRLTALVTLEAEDGSRRTVFIGPEAGGLKIREEGREIVVITPQAPLGRDLIGKSVGEVVSVGSAQTEKDLEIVAVD